MKAPKETEMWVDIGTRKIARAELVVIFMTGYSVHGWELRWHCNYNVQIKLFDSNLVNILNSFLQVRTDLVCEIRTRHNILDCVL